MRGGREERGKTAGGGGKEMKLQDGGKGRNGREGKEVGRKVWGREKEERSQYSVFSCPQKVLCYWRSLRGSVVSIVK